MKVGDILVYAYHYNARYPQFVRVVKTTEKSVWVENVEKKWLSHDGYGQNGLRVPDFDAPTTPVKGCFRIKRFKDGVEYCVIDRCAAFIWDGNPEDEYTD